MFGISFTKSFGRTVEAALILAAAAGSVLQSCSLKEDRSLCGRYLCVDLGEVPSETLDSLGIGTLHISLLGLESLAENALQVTVPDTPGEVSVYLAGKEELSESVFCCSTEGLFDASDGLVIPPGEECPVLYTYWNGIPEFEWTASDTVRLGKNYCRMDVEFVSDRSFAVEICGNVNGYDRQWRPRNGEFRFLADVADRKCRFRVPRQTDSSLELRLLSSGVPARIFPLGMYLKAAGFNWDSYDLGDVSLEIDYCESGAFVRDGGWTGEYGFEIVF